MKFVNNNLLLNLWSTVYKLVSPKLILVVLDEFNKRDEKTPRMRTINNKPFQKNSEEIEIDTVDELKQVMIVLMDTNINCILSLLSKTAQFQMIYLVICSCIASVFASANRYNKTQLK